MYYFAVNNTVAEHYTIYNGTYGPFDPSIPSSQLKEEIYQTSKMSLELNLRQYINPDSPAQGSCYEEKIIQMYNFMYRGVIEVSLEFQRSMCNAESDPFYYEKDDEDKNVGYLSGLW